MNHIRQRVPGFIDGVTPHEADFETLDELLALEWVQKYTQRTSMKFSHFAQADESIFMAMYNKGEKWIGVGYLTHPVDGLPDWGKD